MKLQKGTLAKDFQLWHVIVNVWFEGDNRQNIMIDTVCSLNNIHTWPISYFNSYVEFDELINDVNRYTADGDVYLLIAEVLSGKHDHRFQR